VQEFLAEFPNDEACLVWLWRNRHSEDGTHAHCPKCDQTREFKRYATKQTRQSWTCVGCGHHIHPTAGTIFARSSTSLRHWFYAMFLVSSSRCGIAAKQLEREIGCSYKTALRMLHLIRQELMEQDQYGQLGGIVEADETFVGGKLRESDRRRLKAQGGPHPGPYSKPRATVVGAVERGGRLRASMIPSRGHAEAFVREFVLPGSMIFTDDWLGYSGLHGRNDYRHRRIKHSQRIYVDGPVHTQTIEGFFGHFKTDVRGTHHSISTRWLPGYLNEWVWKWNHRDDDEAMFRQLLDNAARVARSRRVLRLDSLGVEGQAARVDKQLREALAKLDRIEPNLDGIGSRELAELSMTAVASLIEMLVRIEQKLDTNNQLFRDVIKALLEADSRADAPNVRAEPGE
jgi:transposase-like protein